MDKRILALAIAVAVALVAAVPSGAAAGSGTGPQAGAAKTKCKKKKGKKSAASSKGCKKKKKPPPTPVVLPSPLVRGSITWSGAGVDMDLHAYDAAGSHSGLRFDPPTLVQGIPNATHSGDAQTAGSEKFTDNAFLAGGAANREFAYVVCLYNNGSSGTFTGVSKTGASQTIPITGDDGDSILLTIPGGPAGPPANPC